MEGTKRLALFSAFCFKNGKWVMFMRFDFSIRINNKIIIILLLIIIALIIIL